MTPESLKACPCCNGKAYLIENLQGSNAGRTNSLVKCGLCKLRTPLKQDRDDAIKLWNTRAPLPAMEELRDAIVKELNALKADDTQPGFDPDDWKRYCNTRNFVLKEAVEKITAQFASFMAQKKGE